SAPRLSRLLPSIPPPLCGFCNPVYLFHRQAFHLSALPITRPSKSRSLRKAGITSLLTSSLPRVSIATPTHARCISTPKGSNNRFSWQVAPAGSHLLLTPSNSTARALIRPSPPIAFIG